MAAAARISATMGANGRFERQPSWYLSVCLVGLPVIFG